MMYRLAIIVSFCPAISWAEPKLSSKVVYAEKDGPVIVRMEITFSPEDRKQYWHYLPPAPQFEPLTQGVTKIELPPFSRPRQQSIRIGNEILKKVTWYQPLRQHVKLVDGKSVRLRLTVTLGGIGEGRAVDASSDIDISTIEYSTSSRMAAVKEELAAPVCLERNDSIDAIASWWADGWSKADFATHMWMLSQVDIKRGWATQTASDAISILDDEKIGNAAIAHLEATDHPISAGRLILFANRQLESKPLAIDRLLKCRHGYVRLLVATECTTAVKEKSFRENLSSFSSRFDPIAQDAIAKEVARLDDNQYRVRESASRELRSIGPRAIPAMRAWAAKSKPEASARLNKLIEELSAMPTPESNATERDFIEYLTLTKQPRAVEVQRTLAREIPHTWVGQQCARLLAGKK